MNTNKDLEPTGKQPIEKTEEMTYAAQTYTPAVDIWETDEALTIAADMPGVLRDDVEIDLRDDVLTILGRLSIKAYEGLRPIVSEYNVGNYYRRFALGETIDQERISASMADGVLTLTLPKRGRAVPRKVVIA